MSSLFLRNNTRKSKQLNDEEAAYEWEPQVIIKVPNEVVPDINNFIENGEQFDSSLSQQQCNPEEQGEEERSNMAIKFLPNMRNGQLKINDKIMGFKIQDLPCIVETYKTEDKINIYKVADISQIIICNSTPEIPEIPAVECDKNNPNFIESITRHEKLQRCLHGITAPMKNARERRFRKSKKTKYTYAPYIEQELKKLLRSDLDAESITWEVIDGDQMDSKTSENDITIAAVDANDNDIVAAAADVAETL